MMKDRRPYSKALCKFLGIDDDMYAETCTLALSILYPCFHECGNHTDLLNPILRTYFKSGGLNVVLGDKELGHIFLLQVLFAGL